MRIALVHDYFTQLGGAEKVAEELYKMLPGAELLTTVALADKMPAGLRDVPVTTSKMQYLPWMRTLYRLYFPLYPFAVSSLDLSSYDLVISSSSGYMKGVNSNPGAIHICYCHTPPRWIWSFDSYSSRESFGSTLKAILRSLLLGLRRLDEGAARQPDHFIANSKLVADRIYKAYGRFAEVIFPPIDVNRFAISELQSDHFVVLARLVPYKRIDLAVDAFTRMGRKLVVIGSGPALGGLRKNAGPTISFVGRISDEKVEEYVSGCQALIFPGEEDFGMAPLEVASAGRPTIAFGAGGALETVVDGVTGLFFKSQSVESLVEAVQRFDKRAWSQQAIRAHAERFGIDIFQEKMRAFLVKVGAPLPLQVIDHQSSLPTDGF